MNSFNHNYPEVPPSSTASGGGPLSVELHTSEAAFAELQPEWDELAAASSPRTPFGAVLWNRLWWKHFSRDTLIARDHIRVLAVRDGAGRLVGVAPMMLTLRPGSGPLATRELQFLGADRNMTELRGPVCEPDRLRDVFGALRAHLASKPGDWHWTQWNGLRKADSQPDDWRSEFAPETCFDQVNHFIALPESWEDLRASLPRNIKESLRKCYNSLARDGHEFLFRAVEKPDEIRDAIDIFLGLHHRRAETTDTVRHNDVFGQKNARAFLHEYASLQAEAGNMRVFQLIIAGQVVATRIGILLGEEIYLYYSGYDVDWGQYSVMTTVVAEALKWSIAQGLSVANLSTGTDVSKTRWRPRQVEFAGGTVISPAARGRFAYALVEKARARRR